VICHACNMKDMSSNTSGVPNVFYEKGRDRWLYGKMVNRVMYRKFFKTKEEAVCYKYNYELDTEAFLEVPDSTTEVRGLP